MQVTGTTDYNVLGSQTGSTESTKSYDSLGKDDFLNLLVAQLSHQDPLNPMDNTQFVSQMAQYSSLEQMANMNSNMEAFLRAETLSQATALLGKEVKYINNGEVESAKVENIIFEKGVVYAVLDNKGVLDVNNISGINPGDTETIATDTVIQASTLLGKKVEYLDSKGKTVSAKVETITFEDGVVYAKLDNGEKIKIKNITAVSE